MKYNWKAILRRIYLLIAIILVANTFIDLGSLRTAFYKYWLYTMEYHALKSLTSSSYDPTDEMEKKRIQINDELDIILTNNENRQVVRRVFIFLTACFALINGILFSEGTRLIKNYLRLQDSMKEAEKIRIIYSDLQFQPDEKTKDRIKNEIVSKNRSIYMHGYWRGFAEAYPEIHRICERLFYLKILTQNPINNDPQKDYLYPKI